MNTGMINKIQLNKSFEEDVKRKRITNLEEENAKLRDANKLMVEALEKYADKDKYFVDYNEDGYGESYCCHEDDLEIGTIAREARAKAKGLI